MKTTRIVFAFLICAGMGWQARAQSFDTSGNSMLSGNYYFRQVYVSSDGSDLTSAYGEITFSGNGSYTMNALAYDYTESYQNGEGQLSLTTSGKYTISASGLGYISNPLSTGDFVYGLVSQYGQTTSGGIFIGSSTRNASGFNDMFIAAPIPPGAPPFTGSYSVAFVDQYEGTSGTYVLNPNGSGNLGTVNSTYYYYDSTTNASGSTTVSQSGVKYSTVNGAESLTFPTSTSEYYPLYQSEYLYVSPDGNFIFGGSPVAWDFFVGVHPSSAPAFSGLYYQAGFDLYPDGYYGSLYAIPSLGAVLGDQQVLSLGTPPSEDYTYSDSSELSANGSYTDGFGIQHVFGAGGALAVGYGTDGNSGISVYVQGPANLTGPGMYLNPTGVQNQSSSALFTAAIAPGEYITLTGTGLVTGTNVTPNYPASYATSLDGLEVVMNGFPAPLLYSCGQCDGGSDLIIAVVPWELTGTGIVQIQALSSTTGARSNAITLFQGMTAPGLKAAENGIGNASAQLVNNGNFSIITPGNPAQIGDTVVLYAVGLGTVSPSLQDGQAGGSPLTSITEQPISVYFDDGVNPPAQATIGYSALVAGYVNLYQLNVTVPSGINSGEVFVEIEGPDSYTSEATMPISGVASSARAEKPHRRRRAPASPRPRNLNPNPHLPAAVN